LNLAGALADVPADTFRKTDIESAVRTGRTFAWLAVLAALAVSVACLYDTVLVLFDEDEREAAKGSASPGPVTCPLLAELCHSDRHWSVLAGAPSGSRVRPRRRPRSHRR